VLLARELNQLGIKQVSGDLIVAPGFTMNFSGSATRSGERLYDTLARSWKGLAWKTQR